MFFFILRRLLLAIPMVFLATVVVFLLVANAGDPLEELRQRPNSEQAIIARTRALNLDKPAVERYGIWLSGVVRGDFGKDIRGNEVRPQLQRALLITLRLVFVATLLSIVVGVTVGVVSAVRQYTAFDYGATFLAFLFFAMPVFWFAVLLKEFGAIELNNWLENPGVSPLGMAIITVVGALFGSLFTTRREGWEGARKWVGPGVGAAVGLVLALGLRAFLEGRTFSRWISTVGPSSPNFQGSLAARIGDWAGHMILPTITLAIVGFATYSRYQRASMLDTLSSDYVRTARAKGISNRRVIFRHAFRTALIPIATLVALDFGAVLGGAIITENIFAWKGMGSLLREAVIRDIDPNMAMGYLLVTSVTVIVFNIIADITYAYLDPRIRID